MATIITTTELATRLETDPKTLRRFFRSGDSPVKPVGQGNRYSITLGDVRRIKKAFDNWHKAHSRTAASTKAA